jgi:hypothetical protein
MEFWSFSVDVGEVRLGSAVTAPGLRRKLNLGLMLHGGKQMLYD